MAVTPQYRAGPVKRTLRIGLLLSMVSAFGFLAWLGTSESGLRWAYRNLMPGLPGTLTVSQLSGSLAGAVTLSEVSYQDQDQVAMAAEVALDWNPWALLSAKIDITRLVIQRLDVTLSEVSNSDESEQAGFEETGVRFPLPLLFHDTQINGLSITRGDSNLMLEQLRMNLSLEDDRVEIAGVEIESTQLTASLKGAIDTTPPFAHEFELGWRGSLPSGATITGDGEVTGDSKAIRLIQQLGGAMRLKLDLVVNDPLQQLSWQSSIDAEFFDTGIVDASLPQLQGSFSLQGSGDLDNASFNGNMQAESAELGPLNAEFTVSSLDREQRFHGLNFDSLKLAVFEGEVSARGQLHWSPQLSWDVEATTVAVNPQQLFSEWPGKLNADFSSSGGFENDELIVNADIEQLRGSLRGYPVSLQSSLQWREDSLDIERLDFESGGTRGKVQGNIGQQLDLDWSLDSKNLAELYPDASGYLKADGRLEGSRDSPKLKASFSGKSLGLPDYEAGSVEGVMAIDLLRWQQLDISLQARAIRLQDRFLESLDLTTDTRRIQARVVADDVNLELELNGAIADETWRGKVTRLVAQTADFAHWKLKKAAPVRFSRDSLEIESMCLHSDEGSGVCGSIKGQHEAWQTDFELSRVPLYMVSKWFLPNLKTQGLANARVNLDYRFPDVLLGRVDVDLPKSRVSYPLVEGQPERFDYRSGNLEVLLLPAAVRANASMTLSNGDHFEAVINLPRADVLTFDIDKQVLQADIRLVASDLAFFVPLLDGIEDLQGQADIQLSLAGTLANPDLRVDAKLANASLNIPGLDLKLDQININAQSASAEKIIYQADARTVNGRLTVSGQTIMDKSAGWPSEFKVKGERLDLGRLSERRFPPEIRVEGLFDASADLKFQAPDHLSGQMKFSSSEGKLRYPLLEGEKDVWEYHEAWLAVVMDQRGIEANSKLVAGKGNTLNGKLFLPGAKILALDPTTQALRASADLDFKELDLIEALLPEIDKLQGDLALDFRFGGTLEQPELGLDAVISGGSLLVPGLGLSINSISLTGVTEAAGRFDFKIAASSGKGSISIKGDTLLDARSGWPTTMRIEGDNFEVSRIPEARVRVTPDLTIRLQNRTIDIEGEIIVPYAKLQPKDITMAERVSNDTIVIGDEEAPESRWTISTRVSVVLGERVTFFGYGFEGQLGGRLFIEESKGQPTRGTGTIKVIEGRYRAYGQRLEIENGRLLFTGGPVTNPGLDLRAVRKSNTVITGIIVKGRLEQPHLELFSIPAMAQTDILSYLLLGRPLESTTGDEGTMMAKAALALGVVGGDTMARSVGDRFGLDEMRVESDDSGDQASLVVGRYLSPKVYVSYGVGLIESINTLNLRYHVSERWRLEASSGENHGADIMYTIER